jgi:membrane protein implicated in regulation of membrane protease activity
MIDLIENANNWLILGTILIIIELFLIGSFVVFLPAGLAAILVGIIFKIQTSFGFIILSSWAFSLVVWGIFSITLSFLIQKYYKDNSAEDINDY